MESYNLAGITKILYESNQILFKTKTLRDIIPVSPSSTFFSIIQRLEKAEVVQRIERNTYRLHGKEIHDFSLANFIYEPSYVSLQSALNFYGILSQFPYEITSMTSKKSNTKNFNEKAFRYSHVHPELFWGYESVHGFLIAHPEKALLDMLYLQKKGLVTVHMDEYDLTKMNKKRFSEYVQKIPALKGVSL